jgi:putative membrane protein insertion efficiency factor
MTGATQAPSARWPGLPAAAAVGIIRVYQCTASPLLPAIFGVSCACRFYPTCSQYAADAVRTHGALRGGWLAARRIVKCTPLHPGGNDPVPNAPAKRS